MGKFMTEHEEDGMMRTQGEEEMYRRPLQQAVTMEYVMRLHTLSDRESSEGPWYR